MSSTVLVERKYSLREIDAMRRCLWIALFNEDWDVPRNANSLIEERLRTYLMAGVDPSELEEAAAEANKKAEAERILRNRR